MPKTNANFAPNNTTKQWIENIENMNKKKRYQKKGRSCSIYSWAQRKGEAEP